MIKTRRMRSSRRKTEKMYCCEATLHGLNHWYKEEFEKLRGQDTSKINDMYVEGTLSL
jgi:hypothetical protein